MFFESLAEWSLGFTYVCVAAVDVTRDVIDASTLVFFRCFAVGCTTKYLSRYGSTSFLLKRRNFMACRRIYVK